MFALEISKDTAAILKMSVCVLMFLGFQKKMNPHQLIALEGLTVQQYGYAELFSILLESLHFLLLLFS